MRFVRVVARCRMAFEIIIIELPRKRLIKPKALYRYNDLKVNGKFTSMLLMVCKDSINYTAEKIFRPKKTWRIATLVVLPGFEGKILV